MFGYTGESVFLTFSCYLKVVVEGIKVRYRVYN